MARRDAARQSRYGWASPSKTRRGVTGQSGRGKVWHDRAGHGVAVKASQGTARRGLTRPVRAVLARQGKAGQGRVGRGSQG